MITREVVASYAPPREITLTSPPNRTAIVLFACMSVVQYGIAILAFMHGRWEAYLTFLLANISAAIAVMSYFSRYELTLLPRDRFIRTRSGLGPIRFEKHFAFDEITTVRLTLNRRGRANDCSIELVSGNRDIPCPPTPIPRQQALFLAVLIGAPLLKIENTSAHPRRHERSI